MMRRIFQILALVMILILLDVTGAQGDTLPDSAYISGVVGHAQKHNLSCEARSAADLAQYWGISLGENEFLDALPRADNPEQGFVGSLDGVWGKIPPYGYGVHAGPVADTLRTFGLNALAHNHLTWDDLRSEINAGRPVIVWIIGAMWSGNAVNYHAPDGSTSIVAAYEHTMILTGYNRDTVQVVDSYTGQYQTFALSAFLASWKVLGNMAVFSSLDPISQPAPSQEPTPNPTSVEVEPVTRVKVVNFEIHLPLVQQDYYVKSVTTQGSETQSAEPNPGVALQDPNANTKYFTNPVVDRPSVTWLRTIFLPTLYNDGGIATR